MNFAEYAAAAHRVAGVDGSLVVTTRAAGNPSETYADCTHSEEVISRLTENGQRLTATVQRVVVPRLTGATRPAENATAKFVTEPAFQIRAVDESTGLWIVTG